MPKVRIEANNVELDERHVEEFEKTHPAHLR